MIPQGDAGKRGELELAALRALCQGTAEGPLLRECLRILAGYQFIDPIHQVVFQALKEMPTEAGHMIREFLPTRLNNRGFPDLDFENFFLPHSLNREQALELIQRLTAFVDQDSASRSSP